MNTIMPITYDEIEKSYNDEKTFHFKGVLVVIYKQGGHRGQNVGNQLGGAFRFTPWGHMKMKGHFKHQTRMLKAHLDRMIEQAHDKIYLDRYHKNLPVYAITTDTAHIVRHHKDFRTPHLFFYQDEFSKHTDSLFKESPAIQQAHKDYDEAWDRELMMAKLRGDSGAGEKTLPRKIANQLEHIKEEVIQAEVLKQIDLHLEAFNKLKIDYEPYTRHYTFVKCDPAIAKALTTRTKK